MAHDQLFLAEPFAPQPPLRLRALDRVSVQRDQLPSRPKRAHQLHRMPAITERAIDENLSIFWREDPQNFLDHDRPVHSRGGLPRSHYLRNRFRIFRRVQLLVLLLKPAWMRPAVTHPPFAYLRLDRLGRLRLHHLKRSSRDE